MLSYGYDGSLWAIDINGKLVLYAGDNKWIHIPTPIINSSLILNHVVALSRTQIALGFMDTTELAQDREIGGSMTSKSVYPSSTGRWFMRMVP